MPLRSKTPLPARPGEPSQADTFVPRSRRRRGPLGLIAAMVVAALLVLVGCGGDSGGKDYEEKPFGTDAARDGGSMTLSLVGDSRGLDPFTASLSSATDYTRMNALYDMLVWVEPGRSIVQPKIADVFSSPDAGRTWFLRLKSNVKFSDGTPYDAAAVKFTWDRHADPAARSPYAASVRGVTTQVVDPLTLRITLDEPNSRFNQIVATQLSYIVSPTAYRADPQGFARNPVGAGPFTLREWVQGDHQTYVRNPTYWQPGKPHLDELRIRVIGDQEQAFEAVQSGNVDLAVTPDDMGGAKAASSGFEVQDIVVNGASGVHFNSAKAPFNDPRARQALSAAISRDDFNDVLYNGNANPAEGLFAEESPLIDHAAVPKMNADSAKAARLARELAAEGKPIDFTLLMPQSPLSDKIGEYLQSKWNALPDVSVRVELVDITALSLRAVVNRDFQAMYYGMSSPSGEPAFWNFLLGGSPSNYLGFSSAAVDAALRESRKAGSPGELSAAYTKLAQAYAAEVPVMPLVDQSLYAYAKPGRIVGFRFTDAAAIVVEELGLKA